MRDTGLYSEDLFILSQVLKDNISLKEINISKNMIGMTFVDERKLLDMRKKMKEKVSPSHFNKNFYDSLGIEHFALAFKSTDRIRSLDISENEIGSKNFQILLPIFESNIHIENLNIADCQLDGICAEKLCEILKRKNRSLKLLKFRNSKLADNGAKAVANLIRGHMTIVELEIFNCDIDEKGGHHIGDALKTNFCIEKLNIGDNILDT